MFMLMLLLAWRTMIHALILVPVFFALMKERALRRGTLRPPGQQLAAYSLQRNNAAFHSSVSLAML